MYLFLLTAIAVSFLLLAGRALLEFAEREAVRRGFASVHLCTNSRMTENQLLYPKIGYVEYDRRTEAGYDRVYYRKTLT